MPTNAGRWSEISSTVYSRSKLVSVCFRPFFGFFWLVGYKYVAASVCSEVWRIVEIIYMEFNFSLEFVYCSAMFCLFEVITVTGMLTTCS